MAILITGGVYEHMVDFSPPPLQPCDLLLLRAGQVHAFGKDRSIEGEILTFTPEFAGTFSKMPSIAAPFHTLFDAGPRVRLSDHSANLVEAWYEDFSGELALRGRPYSDPRITCSFGLLVNRLAALEEFTTAAERSDNRNSRLVGEFTALLESNFLSHRDSAWYSRKLRVSARTLDRRLVESLKRTCKELITERLVLEAKRLLTDPGLQVKGVAHSLGFDEVANFSRFFRHNAEVTPRDFRSHAPDWPV